MIAEGAAIVVSILLAFSIDAWWDRRGEIQEEASFLESLREEILLAQSDLTFGIEQQTRVRDAGVPWTFMTETTPTDSIITLVEAFGYWHTPELDLPSVRSAVSAGAVPRLRTPGLKEWIAEWTIVSQDTYEEAESVRKWVQEQVYPFYVREKVPVTPIFRATGIPLSGRIPASEVRRLVGDAGFESLVNFSSLLNDTYIQEAKRALEVLEAGLEIIGERSEG